MIYFITLAHGNESLQDMKKDRIVMHRRQREIKMAVNLYQATIKDIKGDSITRQEAIEMVAAELFLSADTIWKDYYK